MSALPVDEGRRQAYLGALGIPLWSARVELPGALPGVPLDFVPWILEPGAEEGGGAPAPAPGLGATTAAGVAPLPADRPAPQAPLRPAPVQQAPVAAGAATAAPSPRDEPAAPRRTAMPPAAGEAAPAFVPADAAADATAPRLGCRAWALAPGLCALVDQGDAPDLSAAEHRLLAAIALALDAPEPPGAVGNLLRWPLNRNPRLDHGPAAMQAWLAHALRLPSGRCLVFGAALAAHARAARPDLEVIAAPSLAELLAGGDAKRRLWQALHG